MIDQAITECAAWGVTQDLHYLWEMRQGRYGHVVRPRAAIYARARSIVVHDRALRELTP